MSKSRFIVSLLTLAIAPQVLAAPAISGAASRAAKSRAAKTQTPQVSSPFWKYGPLEARPRFLYAGSFDSGVLIQPGFPQSTFAHTYSPGLEVKLGRWSVDYTSSITDYSAARLQDTVSHSVSGGGAVAGRNSGLGFRQSYVYSTMPLIETGRQTEVETISTALMANHAFGPKIGLTANLGQNLSFASAAADTYSWNAGTNLSLQPAKRIALTLGVLSGYNVVFKSPDSIFIQPNTGINWSPSSKLTFSGTLSMDNRLYLGRKWSWTESLLYSTAASYRPFATTAVNGTASRTLAPSFFAGQTSDTIILGTAVNQRLLQRFWAEVGLNYQESRYLTVGRTSAVRRKDYNWSYTAAIRTTFLRRGSVSLTYQDVENTSNVNGFSNKSYRIGWNLGFAY